MFRIKGQVNTGERGSFFAQLIDLGLLFFLVPEFFATACVADQPISVVEFVGEIRHLGLRKRFAEEFLFPLVFDEKKFGRHRLKG